LFDAHIGVVGAEFHELCIRDPLLGAQLEARLIEAVVQDLEVCAGMDVAHDAVFFMQK